MPYALCPMPYAGRVPHVTEKGYSAFFLGYNSNKKEVDRDLLPLY